MLEPKIAAADLATWADFLLRHSLGGIGADDIVMIKGERVCWPLMEVLERKVIEAGGVPDVCLVPPNNERGRVWSAEMARAGSGAQIANTPPWHRTRYEAMTKYVEVLGAEDPSRYGGLAADRVAVLAAADEPFTHLRLARPWVVTLYPTAGFAAMEGMDLDGYARFIVGASTADPSLLKRAEEQLEPLMREARTMTLVTTHPDGGRELTLEVDIEHSIPVLSYGLRNFPDGEIFTSPDARSPHGEIFLDLPVHYGGVDIEGIHLVLEHGRITHYSAQKGGDRLAAIIETDDGSHRLGEVALGMNPGLERVLKHPLFVEKVGGTAHIAIGASYEQTYVKDPGSDEGKARLAALLSNGALNKSAQHVDLVADFRPGGCGRRVFLGDKEVVVRDRVWVPA